MSASDIPPPDWLAVKHYAYPEPDDPKGWLNELLRINGLFWNDRDEWRDIIPDIDNYSPGYIPAPPVEVIDRDEAARELSALEQPALLLRVHLTAPDAVIVREFRAELAKVRKTVPALVKNRGRDSLRGNFSRSKLATWKRYRIIELAELLAWRESKPPSRKRPSDAQLGRWLKFDAAEVRVAVRTFENARSMIPALSAQVHAAR
jgi:hypothetical protein